MRRHHAMTVVGTPATQGSHRPFIAGGKARVRENNPAKHASWREAIAAVAREYQETHLDGLLKGPVVLRLRFSLTRSKSAPKRRTWPVGARSGDVDKLTRPVADSLTGTLIADDSQIVGLLVTKDWGDPPGVVITLYELDGEDSIVVMPMPGELVR